MTGNYRHQKYFFDKTIYENRIFDSKGVADPSVEIQFGPNIKDWPEMPALAENLVLKVVSEIHDPVTTTDELIPSGETSSFRSNPLGLAEFTLSRKDPAYVGRAKEIQKAEKALEAGECPAEAVPELKPVMDAIRAHFSDVSKENIGIGSTIFAVKPGDGSAREQAASCQKVLGGWANIANEYATKTLSLQSDQLGYASVSDSCRRPSICKWRLPFLPTGSQGSCRQSGQYYRICSKSRWTEGISGNTWRNDG